MVGGVLASGFVLTAIAFWGYAQVQKRRAHDFRAELARLIEAGEFSGDAAVGEMVPREIPRANVTLTGELGTGQFGQVHKAVLHDRAMRGDFLVAAKLVKEGAPDEYHRALLAEAVLMAQIPEHPNVVSLVGVCLLYTSPSPRDS